MPSTPSRRSALRVAAVALAASSGCLGLSGSDATGPETTETSPSTTAPPAATPPETGTYTDAPSGPEQYPERPADPTPDAVRSYARSFEHAAVTNAMHDFGYGDVEEMSLDCRAVHHAAADGGRTATGEWVVDDGSGFEESGLSVVVAPTGAVSVRRLPLGGFRPQVGGRAPDGAVRDSD